jgi:LuxR family maltose regulon positive regulatory protein
MLKADPLIRTKLHLPFTRPGLVPRPRLQEQIAQGLHGPLTLVTAPAGFGKTTLAAACLAGCGMRVAWLSLDKNDNQPGRFPHYLVAALQAANPALCSEAAQLVDAPEPVPPEAILTCLVNDLDAAQDEIVLALDDYQFITSQSVYEQVAFLLAHCPRTLHLLIASRSDPPLPLARLRARGQMVELRAADLRFTPLEASQFLNDVMGLRLDAAAVTLLEEHTEGWVAGLQMAALSMRDCKDVFGFIEGFSGTNRYILDYLLEEVLAGQPPEIQHFLLCTSILERLAAPLCDAVMAGGDDQATPVRPSVAILDYLEKANLFMVPLDDDRRWYRYHHLFADLLQARLYQSGPEQAARLLSRAAEWCEQEGQVAEAVRYALAAKDDARAAGLIAKYWHYAVNNGEIETAWAWLSALPADVRKSSATLGVACCWVLWLRGQVGAIEPYLVDAECALSAGPAYQRFGVDDVTDAALPAHLAVLHSIVARYAFDFASAVAFAERAMRLLPEHLPPQANAQLRTLIFLAQASAYDGAGNLEKSVTAYAEMIRWSRVSASATGVGVTIRMSGALRVLGRLRAADEACREALTYVEAQGMARLPTSGVLHLAMSEVLLERNDLEAAQAHLAQGIELGKWSGRFDAVRNVAPVLVRLRQAHQDIDGALQAVREAEAAMGEPVPPLARAELLALRARVLARQGALSEAAHCVEEAACLTGRDQGQTHVLVALAAARVTFARCEPEEAAVTLGDEIAVAEASGRLGALLELCILRSLAFARQAKLAEADLERALALAAPEGYARIFLDEGQPMQALLAQWLAHAAAGPLRDYAIHLRAQFEAEAQSALPQGQGNAAGGLPEPLSQRELEVLQLIALGKTNQEIARQLVVAPGTVKAHTASIYRKLDAANRTEAATRARQLGLLP